jgi:hypothetical protein
MSQTSRFYAKEGKVENEYRNRKKKKAVLRSMLYSFCTPHGDQKWYGL